MFDGKLREFDVTARRRGCPPRIVTVSARSTVDAILYAGLLIGSQTGVGQDDLRLWRVTSVRDSAD